MKAKHIWHDGTWSKDELARFITGQFIDRNGKRYRMCAGCRMVIRVDKLFFGSLHICDEIAE